MGQLDSLTEILKRANLNFEYDFFICSKDELDEMLSKKMGILRLIRVKYPCIIIMGMASCFIHLLIILIKRYVLGL